MLFATKSQKHTEKLEKEEKPAEKPTNYQITTTLGYQSNIYIYMYMNKAIFRETQTEI